MSDLEVRASCTLSSIIRDDAAMSFLPRGINVLASFAFKTAVIANHMSLGDDQEPFFTIAARRRFMATQRIPLGVQMWVSRLDLPKGRPRGILSGDIIAIRDTRLEEVHAYVLTFAAGYLVFQLVAARWTDIRNFGQPLPLFKENPRWVAYERPFWPFHGGWTVWPPPESLDNTSIDLFAKRWNERVDLFRLV
jgi:hypothetical protein